MRSFSGPRLRAHRHRVGLTAGQVGSLVGRSEWTVYQYENGRAQPPLSVACALADLLGTPLERLLADDVKPAA